ncbi:hypothetical protein OIU77_025907 [Salix suchowensis]|uniref:Uncharacterized protein n=1 Tax=Salix suchowensis TaxID=1278906 RepID=A0ABQ9C1G4_9ROSI|nr:hypothetical protein OIU77_025907 [Salix suchowensis]
MATFQLILMKKMPQKSKRVEDECVAQRMALEFSSLGRVCTIRYISFVVVVAAIFKLLMGKQILSEDLSTFLHPLRVSLSGKRSCGLKQWLLSHEGSTKLRHQVCPSDNLEVRLLSGSVLDP